MRYWLFKSEPGAYSIDDLKRDKVEPWDGIRNYQARNFLRDEVKKEDKVLFYHSNANPPGVVGVCKVVSEPYPDPTQFEKDNEHYDAKSKKEDPRWYLVDVKFLAKFKNFVSLPYLKTHKKYANMIVTKKGSRLSIQPVSKLDFDDIVKKGLD